MGRPLVPICPRGHDKRVVGRTISSRACNECRREKDRLRRTGCSPDIYQKLMRLQNGVCAVCQCLDQTGLTADHDHSTKHIRGLLCHMCNLAIGNAKDSPDILRKLAAYLEVHVAAPAFAYSNKGEPK